MTLHIDHPEVPNPNLPPSIVLTEADRIGLARVLHEQLTHLGKTGDKLSYGRFLDKVARRRKRERLVSTQTIKTFMMRDATRLLTLDRLAEAFELEGGHEALIQAARKKAYEMGLYKNPQHTTRNTQTKGQLSLDLKETA